MRPGRGRALFRLAQPACNLPANLFLAQILLHLHVPLWREWPKVAVGAPSFLLNDKICLEIAFRRNCQTRLSKKPSDVILEESW